MLSVPFPDMIVCGAGTVAPPAPLSDADLAAIRDRADNVEDLQLKTDLFRLLHEVETCRQKDHS